MFHLTSKIINIGNHIANPQNTNSMKTLLIIKREYLTRVRKRSFIIMTLLVPIIFIGMSFLIGYLAVGSTSKKNVVVKDQSGLFKNKLENKNNLIFVFEGATDAELKKAIKDGQYDAYLNIPTFDANEKESFILYSKDQLGLEAENQITDQLNQVLVNERMKTAGLKTADLEKIQEKTISLKTINDKGQEASSISSYAIGYGSGMILYFFMLFYGMSVMRSVMEEKTNRIAEIIVSSVKPFQLMLGKIIGVALVGLTQFLIWILFIVILGTAFVSTMHFSGDTMAAGNSAANSPQLMEGFKMLMSGTNWVFIGFWFLFYFLGGYFLYASLYAAVGSLVNDDPQESQQFTLPITAPIIIGFVMMTSAIRDPNGAIAVFGSLFPLTSPIVMMARIPFGVPTWQLILSALFLVIGFILTTLLAAKIYRTGILMYGKKITFRELGKWIFYKRK